MNMKRRKVRTFLTVLGVMIGVMSVVALLSVGIGVKEEMIDSMVSSGSVNHTVRNRRQSTVAWIISKIC